MYVGACNVPYCHKRKKRLAYIFSKIHTHIHNSAPIARDKIEIMPVNGMDKIILYML